jgi:hypothetical protein
VRNLKDLQRYKEVRQPGRPEIGLETVVTIDNTRQIRQILKLADEVKAEEVLLTNLLPYNAELAKSSLIGLPRNWRKIRLARVKVGRCTIWADPPQVHAEGAVISVEGDAAPASTPGPSAYPANPSPG